MLFLAILMILIQIPVVVFANTCEGSESTDSEKIIIKEISPNSQLNDLIESNKLSDSDSYIKKTGCSKDATVLSDKSIDSISGNTSVKETNSDEPNNDGTNDDNKSNLYKSKNNAPNVNNIIAKPLTVYNYDFKNDSKEKFLKRFWIKDIVAKQFLDGKPDGSIKAEYTIRVGKDKDDRSGRVLGRTTVIDKEGNIRFEDIYLNVKDEEGNYIFDFGKNFLIIQQEKMENEKIIGSDEYYTVIFDIEKDMNNLVLKELLNGNEDEPLSDENGLNVIYNFNIKTLYDEDKVHHDDEKKDPEVSPDVPENNEDVQPYVPKYYPREEEKIQPDEKPESHMVMPRINDKKTDSMPMSSGVNSKENMNGSKDYKGSISNDKSKLVPKADKNTDTYPSNPSEISPDRRNHHLTSAILNRHVIVMMVVMTIVLGGAAVIAVKKHLQ